VVRIVVRLLSLGVTTWCVAAVVVVGFGGGGSRKKTGCRRRNVIKEDLVAEELKTSGDETVIGNKNQKAVSVLLLQNYLSKLRSRKIFTQATSTDRR